MNIGYFLRLSFITIIDTGGIMGFGLLTLPVSLSINLLLASAILSFNKKFETNKILMIINLIGLLWTVFWFYLYITTPQID